MLSTVYEISRRQECVWLGDEHDQKRSARARRQTLERRAPPPAECGDAGALAAAQRHRVHEVGYGKGAEHGGETYLGREAEPDERAGQHRVS